MAKLGQIGTTTDQQQRGKGRGIFGEETPTGHGTMRASSRELEAQEKWEQTCTLEPEDFLDEVYRSWFLDRSEGIMLGVSAIPAELSPTDALEWVRENFPKVVVNEEEARDHAWCHRGYHKLNPPSPKGDYSAILTEGWT